jgi:hypothetical protein
MDWLKTKNRTSERPACQLRSAVAVATIGTVGPGQVVGNAFGSRPAWPAANTLRRFATVGKRVVPFRGPDCPCLVRAGQFGRSRHHSRLGKPGVGP